MIEQLFRLMKQQGLKVEDSQIAIADRLVKLIAIAAKAACLAMLQLVQARDLAATGARQTSSSPLTTSPSSKPPISASRALPRCRRTRTPNRASHGRRGSSPGSADGMAIPRPNPRGQSHSKTASSTSERSQTAGALEMCASPSVPGREGGRCRTQAIAASVVKPSGLKGHGKAVPSPLTRPAAPGDLSRKGRGVAPCHMQSPSPRILRGGEEEAAASPWSDALNAQQRQTGCQTSAAPTGWTRPKVRFFARYRAN